MQEQHTDFTVRKSGLRVSRGDYPLMGASPDGTVSCQCHGDGCVEVKCPFNQRNNSIDEAAADTKFCLRRKVDGVFTLPQNHPYYGQTQCQMFLTRSIIL